jgi:pimeloyl-ACP methyl ester carboxylesterase
METYLLTSPIRFLTIHGLLLHSWLDRLSNYTHNSKLVANMHSILPLAMLIMSKLSKTMARPHEDRSTFHPAIVWGNCTANDPPRLQCGRMAVPVDHSKPMGESVTLRMARLKSTSNGTAPLGTLLINLGGPGAPTAEFIIGLAVQGERIFSDDLMANYDIVGLDPRGVGISNPVKCDPNIWNERVSLFPTTEKEYQNLVKHNKAVGESCAKLTGNLINHLDTAHVVEDFEMFRRAINNGKNHGLNFLALSYGTQIAIQYAEKYPENIGRFVLDAVADHSLPETATLATASTTNEATLGQFFLWCNTASDSPLKGQEVAALFDTLVKKADESPIPAPACSSTGNHACFSSVTGEDIILNALTLLAGPVTTTTWPMLAAALAEAAQGNATALSTRIITTETDGLYSFLAVACQDWLHESSSFSGMLENTRMLAATSPHTRGFSQNYFGLASCIGWPAPTSNPQHALEKRALKAPPMLLVNALYDPETSIVWATGVHAQLPKSVLLTRNGVGHTSYLARLDGETRDAEEAFLLRAKLPAQGAMLDS